MIQGRTIPTAGYTGINTFSYTRLEPIGVVGAIVPWNAPLMILTWKLGALLAAGCTAVIKPAEETPMSALHVAKLCQEAGFPDGVVNVVTGTGELVRARTVNTRKSTKSRSRAVRRRDMPCRWPLLRPSSA
ncbi:MAG: aldehyde dehydrogenase family protein [Rhodocyclaceae bacterium]|nr:aldehyde dehydrogenase family protein [Rhodocyclaceae bacterium]